MEEDKIILIPFALEHATFSEGGKHKLHILDCDNEIILCGLNSNNLPYSSGTPYIIDLNWLNIADPDNELCKKCKKSAIKILSPKPIKTTQHMEKKIEDYLHLYLGCEVETEKFTATLLGVELPINAIVYRKETGTHVFRLGGIKPLLRPLSSMTEEEFKKLLPELSLDIYNAYNHCINWEDKPKHVLILENRVNTNKLRFIDGICLMKKFYDVLGLIESGLAIDKTKQPQQ